ncbi:MAG: hypothetical protein ABH878_10115, partial [bacterium]
RTTRLAFQMIRHIQGGIRFLTGVSLYERKGWEYVVEPIIGTKREPFLYLQRWGPLLQVYYPSKSGLEFTAEGDLSWVHEWGVDDYAIVNLDMRLTWR